MIRPVTGLLLCALAIALAGPAARVGAQSISTGACESVPADVVLVLDDSGSMAGSSPNDPDNLRITAAHLLVDLLQPGDRAGLVLFSSRHVDVPLQPLPDGAETLHQAIELFQSRGSTRLDNAVSTALAMLVGSGSDRRRALVLLTDGRPDPDPEAQKDRLRQLAERAASMGVTVYALGLGESFDRDLLLNIASVTRSPLIWNVRVPSDLTAAYLEVFRGVKGSNVLSVPKAGLDLSSLAQRATLVSLGSQDRAAAGIMRLPGGQQVSGLVQAFGERVRYGYDLFTLQTPPPGRVSYPGEVVWLVEQPGLDMGFAHLTQRAEVPVGEPFPVNMMLKACSGTPLPPVDVQVQVLDSNRNPTEVVGDLQPDPNGPPGSFSGLLTIDKPGTYVLTARANSEGRQMAQTDVTVQAAEQDRWGLVVPDSADSFSPLAVKVSHYRGGQPAGGSPFVTARMPDGSSHPVALSPGAEQGTWIGQSFSHRGQEGMVTFSLSGTDLSAVTTVSPVHLRLDPPETWQWSFLSAWRKNPHTATIRATATADVPVDGLPGVQLQGMPFAGGVVNWARVGPGRYTTDMTVTPQGGMRLHLLFPREFPGTLSALASPGLVTAGPVSAKARVTPLLPWWLLAGLLAAILLGLVGFRIWLYSGPQLRAWIVGPNGALIDLMNDRRLRHRIRARNAVTIGGPNSDAELVRNWLPAGAKARIEAMPPVGQEQYSLMNLSPEKTPLTREGFPRREIVFGDKAQRVEWGVVRLTLRRK